MDISGFGIASVAVITVICYLIGMAVFATALAARSASAKAGKLCLYHAP